MIPSRLMEMYGLPTFEEWQEAIDAGAYENFEELYRTFLIATDHIPNKIIEKLIEDLASATALNFIAAFIDFIKAVRIDYQELLQYRKLAREEIDRLEVKQSQ